MSHKHITTNSAKTRKMNFKNPQSQHWSDIKAPRDSNSSSPWKLNQVQKSPIQRVHNYLPLKFSITHISQNSLYQSSKITIIWIAPIIHYFIILYSPLKPHLTNKDHYFITIGINFEIPFQFLAFGTLIAQIQCFNVHKLQNNHEPSNHHINVKFTTQSNFLTSQTFHQTPTYPYIITLPFNFNF